MAHWSDNVLKDIEGAFKVFILSTILIYVALAIIKSLYPNFPLDNNSNYIVAVIFGLFITFINYIKNKNKI